MDNGKTKCSQALPRTTYYLGLHRPTIKKLYSGQIWLVDELQKTALECNRGLYIHNTRTRHGYKMSTKPTLQQLKNVFLT